MQNCLNRHDLFCGKELGECPPLRTRRSINRNAVHLLIMMTTERGIPVFGFVVLILCLTGCMKSGEKKVQINSPRDESEKSVKVFDTVSRPEPVKKRPPEKKLCIIEELEAKYKNATDVKQRIMRETIGGLKLGMDSEEAVSMLSEPDSKTKPVEEAASGYIKSEWIWKSKGVQLTMDSSDGKNKVVAIVVRHPFKGKTSCGISIGSTMEEVKNIYGKYLDEDFSQGDSIITGTVYGGILFSKGASSYEIGSIAIGAFAE